MLKYLLPLLLAGCGGLAPEDEAVLNGTASEVVVEPPKTGTCMEHAERSKAGSFTRHSLDGGVTWHHGGCRAGG